MVQASSSALSRDGWSAHELKVMAAHYWWSVEELRTTRETVYPEGLLGMLGVC